MDKLIASFPKQLDEALNIGSSFQFSKDNFTPKNIVISGLGGSGIGGGIVKDYAFPIISIPMYVNKHYFLPAYVNEDSLVIICSYSGNTEETIQAIEDAIIKNAKIVCISSGGEIVEIAKSKNLDCIIIPGGSEPRANLGYSLVQILYTFLHFRILGTSFENEIRDAITLLQKESEFIKEHAQQLAKDIHGKIPVIYSSNSIEDIGVRWRQQLNENSKILAWENVFPELNHNELVGWSGNHEHLAVIFLRNDDDYERIQTRMEITKEVIKKCTPFLFEVFSKGNSFFEKAFYLIYFGDWVSYYLANLNEVDPVKVDVIDYLKKELGNK